MIPTSPEDCTYQVLSPYKALNILAMANISENTPLDSREVGVHPLKGATETILHSSEKFQKSKMFEKRGCDPQIQKSASDILSTLL